MATLTKVVHELCSDEPTAANYHDLHVIQSYTFVDGLLQKVVADPQSMNSAASASHMPPNPTFAHNAFNCSRSSYSLPAVRRLICCIASVTAKPSFNCLSCAGVALFKLSILHASAGIRACKESSFSASLNSFESMIWRIFSLVVMVRPGLQLKPVPLPAFDSDL